MGGLMAMKPKGPQPSKPKIKPGKKMRKVFWGRVLLPVSAADSSKIIWSKLSDAKFDQSEFMNLFCDKPPASKGGAGGVAAAAKPKKTVVRALDDKRSNAIGSKKIMKMLPCHDF